MQGKALGEGVVAEARLQLLLSLLRCGCRAVVHDIQVLQGWPGNCNCLSFIPVQVVVSCRHVFCFNLFQLKCTYFVHDVQNISGNTYHLYKTKCIKYVYFVNAA